MKHDPTPELESGPPEVTPELPVALLDAMRGLEAEPGFDDRALADLDTAVLSGARQHIEGLNQRRRMRLVFTCVAAGSGLAAAAAITLVVWMGGIGSTNTPPAFVDGGDNTTAQPEVAPGAHPGVDILDAFALARHQRDGDEQIDQAEIDAVAFRAVSISAPQGGGRG